MRHFRHSSNPGADRRFIDAIESGLRAKGAVVTRLSTADLSNFPPSSSPPWDVIINASRNRTILQLLDAWQALGTVIINSPQSVARALNRPALFATLATHDLRSPSTGWSYTAARPETDRWITKPAWSSACTARVSVASDWCVVQERIAGGRESKIYAIREKPLVPPDACYSKAELDQIEYVVSTCHSATGLAYFGIDIMWHADEPWIIDVNDMPSYRLVPDAAQEIITDILAIR